MFFNFVAQVHALHLLLDEQAKVVGQAFKNRVLTHGDYRAGPQFALLHLAFELMKHHLNALGGNLPTVVGFALAESSRWVTSFKAFGSEGKPLAAGIAESSERSSADPLYGLEAGGGNLLGRNLVVGWCVN